MAAGRKRAWSRGSRERGESDFQPVERSAYRFEVAPAYRVRERASNELDVRCTGWRARECPVEERGVSRRRRTSPERLLDAAPDAVKKPQRRRTRGAYRPIRPRECIHVLEW